METSRLRITLLSVSVSVMFSFVSSHWPGSDGRSAAALDLVNWSLLGIYAFWFSDRAVLRLFLAAAVFGLVELGADFLCVRCTRTLDYSVARSWQLLESPWWMPFSWALVAVQMAVFGEAAIRRFSLIKGALLSGLLGSLLIPFYEEMAWGANWWRYRNCLRVGHTPLYIVVAEAVIGGGLALMGYFVLRARSRSIVLLLGASAGLVTILGGMIGWGLVEFIGRGERPYGLFP